MVVHVMTSAADVACLSVCRQSCPVPRHLVCAGVVQLFSTVVMWSDLQQPSVLNLNHLSHELFGGEDELVVDDPARSVVGQTAVGVNSDCLLVFHCLVLTRLAQPRRVIEESGSDCLSTTPLLITTRSLHPPSLRHVTATFGLKWQFTHPKKCYWEYLAHNINMTP